MYSIYAALCSRVSIEGSFPATAAAETTTKQCNTAADEADKRSDSNQADNGDSGYCERSKEGL